MRHRRCRCGSRRPRRLRRTLVSQSARAGLVLSERAGMPRRLRLPRARKAEAADRGAARRPAGDQGERAARLADQGERSPSARGAAPRGARAQDEAAADGALDRRLRPSARRSARPAPCPGGGRSSGQRCRGAARAASDLIQSALLRVRARRASSSARGFPTAASGRTASAPSSSPTRLTTARRPNAGVPSSPLAGCPRAPRTGSESVRRSGTPLPSRDVGVRSRSRAGACPAEGQCRPSATTRQPRRELGCGGLARVR